MIVARTPLRVSFLGGGRDFPDYYLKYGGQVLAMTIDKYIYVVVKKRFDSRIVLHYTKTEVVDSVDDLKHDLVREAMRLVGATQGIEIATLADIPSEGTGLGSSSSLTVGLLHALYAYRGQVPSPGKLAEETCRIEIDILGKGVGKQDQYMAAYGGFQRIAFGEKDIELVSLGDRMAERVAKRTMLFYTGISREAAPILATQRSNIESHIIELKEMVALCNQGRDMLARGNYAEVGRLIDASWKLKKQLADGITNPEIDAMCQKAMAAGALGVKVCGAGGGGFLLIYCNEGKRQPIRDALSGYRELPVGFDPKGSQIILRS